MKEIEPLSLKIKNERDKTIVTKNMVSSRII